MYRMFNEKSFNENFSLREIYKNNNSKKKKEKREENTMTLRMHMR